MCVWQVPNLQRSAVPDATWQSDPGVYGTADAFGQEQNAIDIGPLFAYGSLRQLQDVVTNGTGFVEDFTEDTQRILGGELSSARARRSSFNLQRLYNTRICNPIYKYTIEDAVGDPPYTDAPLIRDSSSERASGGGYDMSVPKEELGFSDFDRVLSAGCDTGQECEASGAYSFRAQSLYQYVYVTSSHDPEVRPGWHRMLDLKAWNGDSCVTNANQPCRSYATFEFQTGAEASQYQTDGDRYIFSLVASNNLGLHIQPSDTALEAGFELSGVGMGKFARAQLRTAADFYDQLQALDSSLGTDERAQILEQRLSAQTDDRIDTLLTRKQRQYSRGRRLAEARAQRRRRRLVLTDAGAQLLETHLGVTEEELHAALGTDRHYVVTINMGVAQSVPTLPFRTGRAALFDTRCSDALHAAGFDIEPCTGAAATSKTAWYAGDDVCSSYKLELDDARRDRYATYYYDRLRDKAPPPRPPPKPPPPSPPSPPPPVPPPSPPAARDAGYLSSAIDSAERDFCDSVRASRTFEALRTRVLLSNRCISDPCVRAPTGRSTSSPPRRGAPPSRSRSTRRSSSATTSRHRRCRPWRPTSPRRRRRPRRRGPGCRRPRPGASPTSTRRACCFRPSSSPRSAPTTPRSPTTPATSWACAATRPRPRAPRPSWRCRETPTRGRSATRRSSGSGRCPAARATRPFAASTARGPAARPRTTTCSRRRWRWTFPPT